MTQKRLKEVLDYDEKTGIFLWKKGFSRRVKAGTVAGADKNGYREVHIEGNRYRLHHLAWLYVYGVMPTKTIDHKNRIKSDNWIDNLREVTQQENCKNRTMSKNNTSGVNGVTWDNVRNKWRVQIMVKKVSKYLGLFKELSDAKEARMLANVKYGFDKTHGEAKC